MRSIYFIFLFLVFSIYTFSKSKVDTSFANQLFQIADSLLLVEEYDSSIMFFQQSAEIYKKALALKQKLTDEFNKYKYLYNWIANVFYSKLQYDSALYYYQHDEASSSRFLDRLNSDWSIIYSSIGNTYYRLDENEKALEYYLKALNFDTKYYDKDNIETIYVTKPNYNEENVIQNGSIAIKF